MEHTSLTTEESNTQDVSFDAAFEEALGSLNEPEKTEPDKTEPEKTEPEKTEPEKTEPEKTEPEKTEPDKTEPKPATVVLSDEDKASIASIKAEFEKMQKEKSEPEKKTELPKTDEDWTKFKEDWPEVASVIEKEREKVLQQAQDLVSKALEPFKADLGNVVKKNEEVELDKFVRDVQTVHPKAIEELPALLDWAGKQPKHVALGIQQVLENSRDPKEVIAVYDSFKAATGVTKEEVKEETDKKGLLSKMEAVTTKRTNSPPKQIDPDDFDSAFEQAVKQFVK